jgi:hypothetical protein
VAAGGVAGDERQCPRVETRYKTSSGRHLILDLHAAALVATLTDASLAETGTGTVQADIRTAGLGQLLRHEQQFWYDSLV